MNKWLVGLVVLIAGVVVGWYVLAGKNTGQPASSTPSMVSETPASGSPSANGAAGQKGGTMERVVVTYTDSGFGPKSITAKKGTTVTFVNESSSSLWVASSPHPTHTDLPGFDELTSVAKGGTYEYTFVKVGTWKYHNHMNPSYTGSVVVTE